MRELDQKSSKEDELDLVFAEEFSCDRGFVDRYIRLILETNPQLAEFPMFDVEKVTPQPRLREGGYGDLFVLGRSEAGRTALLIEHKITAGPAFRQADRYRGHAEHLREQGWIVLTVLAAPQSYSGESSLYDARIALESAIGIIQGEDTRRAKYRKDRLLRAIEKKNSSGVQIHDEAVHRLHVAYAEASAHYCIAIGLQFVFPSPKQRYYDGDSWISRIRHPELPKEMELRHRLWVSVRSDYGQVDLIARYPDEMTRLRFESHPPECATLSTFSKSGLQVSVPVPALKANAAFERERVEEACRQMDRLLRWFKGL